MSACDRVLGDPTVMGLSLGRYCDSCGIGWQRMGEDRPKPRFSLSCLSDLPSQLTRNPAFIPQRKGIVAHKLIERDRFVSSEPLDVVRQ
jgi:hypothetical protein